MDSFIDMNSKTSTDLSADVSSQPKCCSCEPHLDFKWKRKDEKDIWLLTSPKSV